MERPDHLGRLTILERSRSNSRKGSDVHSETEAPLSAQFALTKRRSYEECSATGSPVGSTAESLRWSQPGYRNESGDRYTVRSIRYQPGPRVDLSPPRV